MAAAIQTANANGHFIYMLNWWMDLTLTLGGSQLGTLFCPVPWPAAFKCGPCLCRTRSRSRNSYCCRRRLSSSSRTAPEVRQINAIAQHPSIKDAMAPLFWTTILSRLALTIRRYWWSTGRAV